MGAESLRDRGIITRMSLDIDIASDASYPEIASKLKKAGIQAPLHFEKGTRKTLRRGVLITEIDGIEVDIHFDKETKLKDYEDIEFEEGKITKVRTPFISIEDHLIRKLLRYNPDDRTDIQEILSSGRVDWKRFEDKLNYLSEGDRRKLKRNLNLSRRR